MNHTSDKELALRRSSLFCDVSPQVLLAIMKDAATVWFRPGEFLFRAGELPDYLYVIVTGSAKMIAGEPGRNETVIELLQPADSVLVSAVMTNRPYLMSALAIEPVKALTIPSSLLREHVTTDPQLALTIIASLSNQYRQMVLHMKDLRLRTSGQRLGVYLMGLAGKNRGEATIVLPHAKKLIASRLNMTPENLSRAIQALRAYGVEVVEDEVRMSDIEAVRDYCRVESILGELDDEFGLLTER